MNSISNIKLSLLQLGTPVYKPVMPTFINSIPALYSIF
jgi:hypothetical protein